VNSTKKFTAKPFTMLVISWPHLRLRYSPSRETCPFSGCFPSLTGRSGRHRNCHADRICTIRQQPTCRNLFRLYAARYCDIIWGKGTVPVHIIQLKYSWSYEYIASAIQTSSQLHALAALPLVKEPPTHNEVRYAPEPVWTIQGDILLPLPENEPPFLPCPPNSLVTVPNELTRLLWHYLTHVHPVQGLFIQRYFIHHAVTGKLWTPNSRHVVKPLWPILKYPISLR
jgi:hypothetical protein